MRPSMGTSLCSFGARAFGSCIFTYTRYFFFLLTVSGLLFFGAITFGLITSIFSCGCLVLGRDFLTGRSLFCWYFLFSNFLELACLYVRSGNICIEFDDGIKSVLFSVNHEGILAST